MLHCMISRLSRCISVVLLVSAALFGAVPVQAQLGDARSATATYTWNSTTGVIDFNWTSTNFTCDGPTTVGPDPEPVTGVTIDATTMTWAGDNMTWTRASGTPGEIVGTWTTSDSTTGNTYTATFNANGTGSLTANIVQCSAGGGGGDSQNIQVEMRTDRSANYNAGPRQHVNIDLSQPIGTVSSVSVSGPGITNSLQLTPGPTRVEAGVLFDSFFGGFDPITTIQSGATYTFTATKTAAAGGGTSTFSQTYTGTAVTNTTTGAITITSPTGFALANASLGSPLTVQWTLPTAYTISELTLGGYVQTSASGSNQGYSCWVNGPTLATNATSGSLTLPTVCGPNNDAAASAGINVWAVGANGERSIIIYQFSDTTGGADTQAPTVPAGLSATAASATQVNLTWTVATDNVGVSYYKVYRNGVAAGTPAGANNTFWPDTQVSAGSAYTYTVSACDAANNCSAQSNASSIVLISNTTITLDGAVGDWAGINPLANDPQGDMVQGYTGSTLPGSDIKALYAAKDANYLYLRLDLWDSFNTQFGNWPDAPYGGSYRFNIASNSPTYSSLNLGVAYGVNPGTPNSGKWSVGYNGAGSIPGTPEADWSNYVAINGSTLEMKVPLANIGNPTSIFGMQMDVTDCCILTKPITTLDRVAVGSLTATSGGTTTTTVATTTTTTVFQTTTTTTAATTTTTTSTTTTTLAAGASATVVPGWNLLGNGRSDSINVSGAFGDPSLVNTVWKWTGNAWAFYAPSLADGGAAYAAGKGYSFLTTVDAGEGFWVNAKIGFQVPLSGNPVPTNRFADALQGANGLPAGWSLIAIGDNPTPGEFVNNIALSPPSAGQLVATSITTLWAWEANTPSGWYFFAPSLVNAGTQAAYISSKNYLDFATAGKKLTPTTGFWVNRP